MGFWNGGMERCFLGLNLLCFCLVIIQLLQVGKVDLNPGSPFKREQSMPLSPTAHGESYMDWMIKVSYYA